jgi:hypothetical protein
VFTQNNGILGDPLDCTIGEGIVFTQKISMFAVDHHGDKTAGGANYPTQADLADEKALSACTGASGGIAKPLYDGTDKGITPAFG